MRGRFITLEGGEGSGKTTQTPLLAAALTARGHKVVATREPGGTPGAERLRKLLLGGGIDWHPTTEALLHFAARNEHVEQVILPALHAGTWVVCDRYIDSTMAYQGYGMNADRDAIATLARLLCPVPDMTLILEVSPTTAAARLAARGAPADRYEALDDAFHRRVADGFREIARNARERCVMIDATGDQAAVHGAIMAAVRERLGIG